MYPANVSLVMKTNVLLALLPLLFTVVAYAADNVQKAIAVMSPTAGSKVTGTVTFTKAGDGVKIVAELNGLTPGKHGFHIHEFGDCSDPKAESAGSHYNPTSEPHAGHDAEKRHVGDLGNIEADASGKARLELTDEDMEFTGDKGIVGHAVIVHEKADDLKTQPTGDAGGRLACGVIGVATPWGQSRQLLRAADSPAQRAVPTIASRARIRACWSSTISEVRRRAQNGPVAARVHVQVNASESKSTREGKPYCEIVVADACDRMTLRVWSDHPDYRACEALQASEFIEISGEFAQHQQFGLEAKQWSVRRLSSQETPSCCKARRSCAPNRRRIGHT